MTRHASRFAIQIGKTARSYPAWLEWPAHVIPYRFRAIHRWWASQAGFFWSPCPLCGQPFGGHEWRDIDGLPSAVPDPTRWPLHVGICPRCTRAGRGIAEWA